MSNNVTPPAPSKLVLLLSLCKCGVFLTVNEHRDYYQKAVDALEEIQARDSDHEPPADPETMQKMIETDTIIHLQFYPDTPIGFYSIYHYDLDLALDKALSCFPGQQ